MAMFVVNCFGLTKALYGAVPGAGWLRRVAELTAKCVLAVTSWEQSTHLFAADSFVDLGFPLNFMPVTVFYPSDGCALRKDAKLGPALVSLRRAVLHVSGGSTTPVLSGCFVPLGFAQGCCHPAAFSPPSLPRTSYSAAVAPQLFVLPARISWDLARSHA